MLSCHVCLDEHESLPFQCPSPFCKYQVCVTCVKSSLEHSQTCPECHKPIARDMVEAVLGKLAVLYLEDEVRPQIEAQLRVEQDQREKAKVVMSGYVDKVNRIWEKLTDDLNLKCPRCNAVFHDYDGCNALTCSSCRAAFCAVCLKDCGIDAHACARGHGDLFDKRLFEQAKKEREEKIISDMLQRNADEPYEVLEHLRKRSEALIQGPATTLKHNAGVLFVDRARRAIREEVSADRLSLLCDDHIEEQWDLKSEDISPRCAIPEEYHLWLEPINETAICVLTLEKLNDQQCYVKVPLPSADKSESSIVDQLVNIKQDLLNCVIAFEGADCLYQTARANVGNTTKEIAKDSIPLHFYKVTKDGALESEPLFLHMLGLEDGYRVLGVNQNLRLAILQRHCENSDASDLLSKPLRVLVGEDLPERIIEDIERPAPDTLEELNEEQKSVAHPLCLRSARECAGPPGTGKTKTIVETIRGLLACTDFDVFILSERNGAIDAIAEKFARESIEATRNSQSIRDFSLWSAILSYGSGGMGDFTKIFTMGAKKGLHPWVVSAKSNLASREKAEEVEAKKMRAELVSSLSQIKLDFVSLRALTGIEQIQNGSLDELKKPMSLILTLESIIKDIGALCNLQGEPPEKSLRELHSMFTPLQHIFPIDSKMKLKPSMERLLGCLNELFVKKARLFDKSAAEQLQVETEKAYRLLLDASKKAEAYLHMSCRVRVATIGSSHKMLSPTDENPYTSSEECGFPEEFLNDREEGPKRAFFIIDEAGCIPSFELLGLSRIGRPIEGLLVVGDKHQLPPYSSNSSFGKTKTAVTTHHTRSILDESVLRVDDGSLVTLFLQYRVPRDIASILNTYIYNGRYETPWDSSTVATGFNLIHVERSRRTEESYVNRDEITKCIDILKRLLSSGEESIMVITPYKKQQRELQHKFRNFSREIPVHTIDQCQGQEADHVLLSLVRKPTRFLTKNRLNVAMSRTRKVLYFICDKEDFRSKALEKKWECSSMALGILELAEGQKRRAQEEDIYAFLRP